MSEDTDTRRKNYRWQVRNKTDSHTSDMGRQLAVLMDIRDELQELNAVFRCGNFLNLPHVLKRIDRRLKSHIPLTKRKKK